MERGAISCAFDGDDHDENLGCLHIWNARPIFRSARAAPGLSGPPSGPAGALPDQMQPDSRQASSRGWDGTWDGRALHSRHPDVQVEFGGWLAGPLLVADQADLVKACRRVVARRSGWNTEYDGDLDAAESWGQPVWSRNVSNFIVDGAFPRMGSAEHGSRPWNRRSVKDGSRDIWPPHALR